MSAAHAFRSLVLALVLLAAPAAAIEHGREMPFDTEVTALRPGEYIWSPELAPSGPVLVVVSLPEQLAFVYRNGVRIGASTVSSGKPGHVTPTGIFSILQRRKEHYSNLYNNAPMPYMQRLTWDGIALHAGNLPGYPASHGCVRMPLDFARRLFDVTRTGMTVVVSDDIGFAPQVAHPGLFSPADADGTARPDPAVPADADVTWTPELAAEGPLTIVVSTHERRVVVLREGQVIGNAPIAIEGDAPFGSHAYVLLDEPPSGASRIVPGRDALRWLTVPLPGETHLGEGIDPDAIARIRAPPVFSQEVYDALSPGATLLVTDAPARARVAGTELTVLRGDAIPGVTPVSSPVEVRDVLVPQE
ncbi:L,D-transpeptidase [Coralloluteibacterium thermophilus]|uniref:L,D-transpeptidase n=1 Tax=Coralloluteibacterium thermophilum TaxID=2707049 RepID=A0ABV9NJD3_9GAMM